MKKLFVISLAFTFVIAMVSLAESVECTTIQEGGLTTELSTDAELTTGFDGWGHNYQARIFNGKYCDNYLGASWCAAYNDIDLNMKWNDQWLSNKDCNGDGFLDRPSDDGGSYIGSGGWLTNHQSGRVDVNGKLKKWTYYIKIIAVNDDANLFQLADDKWYWFDGDQPTFATLIGENIWGHSAIVLTIYNDPALGLHGIQFKSPTGPGLGQY